MADRRDLDFSYSLTDRVIRLSLGELPDFSGAKFDGNFVLRVVSSTSGRLDYIETINRWNARIGQPSFRKTLLKLRLIPHWLTSSDFRLAFTSGESVNQVCFQRELLDHHRIVFEKPTRDHGR